ncbi:terminase small subunit [Candidatus Pacearchaeota archaeon]|nr:terminase small subunit [Candidatus Pacearchaeota archaeon]
MAKNKLTQKQEQFCREYIIDFNATQAAIRAGYSKKTANRTGSENLSKPDIQKRLVELIKERQKRTENRADEAMNECVRIALVDIAEAFNPDGTLKSIHDIPTDIRKAISGFEVEDIFESKGKDREHVGTLTKVKFWSKDKQIENLFKHHGLFEKDNEQGQQRIAPVIITFGSEEYGKHKKA